MHEVTSPQAFEGLRLAGRRVRRPELTVATVDHNVPTGDRRLPIADQISARQVAALVRNAREFGVELFDLDSPEQGIVHVIGPGAGPHPARHDHRLRRLPHLHPRRVRRARVRHRHERGRARARHPVHRAVPAPDDGGALRRAARRPGSTAKDLILALIRRIGTAGATGHVIEYTGEAIRALSMEGRMTVCNMSIEAGARAGMIAPDETTFAYLEGRPRAPTGPRWERARWRLGGARDRPGRRATTRTIDDRRRRAGARRSPGGPVPG